MGQIADLIKANATFKEGFDIAEVEKLENDLNPLSNLTDVDKALDFIGRNDYLSRANTKAITQAIEKHDKKFNDEKFPELIKAERDKLMKELNPEETPEQKKIRELSDKIAEAERKEKASVLKSELMAKAKELGYPHGIDIFMGLGDTALETLEAFHVSNQAYLDKQIEDVKKGLYKGNQTPTKGKPEVPPDIDEQINKAKAEGNSTLAMKLLIKKQQPQQ